QVVPLRPPPVGAGQPALSSPTVVVPPTVKRDFVRRSADYRIRRPSSFTETCPLPTVRITFANSGRPGCDDRFRLIGSVGSRSRRHSPSVFVPRDAAARAAPAPLGESAVVIAASGWYPDPDRSHLVGTSPESFGLPDCQPRPWPIAPQRELLGLRVRIAAGRRVGDPDHDRGFAGLPELSRDAGLRFDGELDRACAADRSGHLPDPASCQSKGP